jgi:hypothetical protein
MLPIMVIKEGDVIYWLRNFIKEEWREQYMVVTKRKDLLVLGMKITR